MSEQFLYWFGAVTFFIILLAISTLAIWASIEGIYRVYEKHWYKSREVGAKDFAARIASDAYWFSEDMPTVGLLRNIGEMATLGYSWDPSRIREIWREAREQSKKTKAEEK